MHSMSKERGITLGICVVHGVTRVIQHDIVGGVIIGVNQGIFHVDFGNPIRVATRSVCYDISRQAHADFDFVSTSENLLWPLCIENEEQNGGETKTDVEERETMIKS